MELLREMCLFRERNKSLEYVDQTELRNDRRKIEDVKDFPGILISEMI